MFIVLGLQNYGNRTIAMIKDDKEKLSHTFLSIYCMQLCCGIIGSLSYIFYVVLISEHVLLGWIHVLYILSVVLDVSWFMFGMEEFMMISIRTILVKIATIIAVLFFVKSPDDVVIYAGIMSGSYLVSALILWSFVLTHIKFISFAWRDVKSHIKPNLTLFIPVMAISIYMHMDVLMLGFSRTTEEVGYYTSVSSIVRLPLSFITALGTVMLPRVSNLLANNDEGAANRYMYNSLCVVLIVTSAICFGIMSIADIFFPWFLGSGYESCVVLAYIMLPSQFFLAYANVLRTQHIIPYKKDKIYINSVLIGAVVNFGLNVLLIIKWGAVGATIATLIAEGAVCIYQAIKIREYVNHGKVFKFSCPFLLLGVVMFICTYFLPEFNDNMLFMLGVKIILGASIFLLGAWSISRVLKLHNKY